MTLSTVSTPPRNDKTAIERSLVTRSSMAEWKGTALPTESEHERLVAEFLGGVEATDPDRYAETCERHVVKSESYLDDIRKNETSAFAPSHEGNGGAGFSEAGESERDFGSASVDERESVNATVQAAMMAPPLLP